MDPAKDADGLHPVNLGRLVLGQPGPLPCTPNGIVLLLRRFGVPIDGADVTVMTDAKIISVPTDKLDRASDGCRHQFDRAFMEILVERLTMANIRLSGV